MAMGNDLTKQVCRPQHVLLVGTSVHAHVQAYKVRMNEMRILAQWSLLILASLGNIGEVATLTPRGRAAVIEGPFAGEDPDSVPLAERPFVAVWNVKNSDRCLTEFGIDLALASNGILTNSPAGDVLVYFNHAGLGLFPYILKGRFINGGLPQLVNMTAHLEKAAVDIMAAIPDANYSSLVVIDWEFWSPVWDKNVGVPGSELYLAESLALVRRRHPAWDQSTVEATAKVEFEEAARSLYEGTVALVHQLRPKALCGTYHFPYCMNRLDPRHCGSISVISNDQMSWLADVSPTLYPSIYIKEEDTRSGTTVYIETILQEAVRVRQISKNPSKPMYSYVALNYSHTGLFLNLEDMNNSVLLPAEHGLAGVVFWGDNNDTGNRAACLGLQKDIKLSVGPLVLKTARAAELCSAALCNRHGRCVGKILECAARAPSRGARGTPANFGGERKSSECLCRCYDGWSGTDCSISLLIEPESV